MINYHGGAVKIVRWGIAIIGQMYIEENGDYVFKPVKITAYSQEILSELSKELKKLNEGLTHI